MNVEDLRIVVNNINKKIEDAEKHNFFGDVLDYLKNTNYGLAYDNEYTRKEFAKYYKCSIYNYIRKKIYETILTKIVNDEISPPKVKKQNLLGIKHFIIKVEKFYKKSFDEIVKNYRDDRESQRKAINEIDTFIKNCDYITKYYVDPEIQTVTMEIDPIKYFLFMIGLYKPIIVSPYIKNCLDNESSDLIKKVLLLTVEKYYKTGLPKDSIIEFADEEMTLGINRLDSYNLQSPIAWGDNYLYFHIYNEEEKALLTKIIKYNFDALLNHLSIINTLSIFEYYTSENQYYTKKIYNIRYILKKNSPKKEASINDFIELIQKGLVVSSD